MATPKTVNLDPQVVQVIMICFMGVVLYIFSVCCLICCTPARDDNRDLNNYPSELRKIGRLPEEADEEPRYYDKETAPVDLFETLVPKHTYTMVTVSRGSCEIKHGDRFSRSLHHETKRSSYVDPFSDVPVTIENMSDDLQFFVELFERIYPDEEEEKKRKDE